METLKQDNERKSACSRKWVIIIIIVMHGAELTPGFCLLISVNVREKFSCTDTSAICARITLIAVSDSSRWLSRKSWMLQQARIFLLN